MHPGLASPWVMFHRLLLRGLRRGVKGLGMPVTFFWPCDLPTSREGSSSSGRTGLRIRTPSHVAGPVCNGLGHKSGFRHHCSVAMGEDAAGAQLVVSQGFRFAAIDFASCEDYTCNRQGCLGEDLHKTTVGQL